MTSVLMCFFNKVKDSFWYHLTSIAIISIAWVLLFSMNSLVLEHIEISSLISWIFIPAGLRLIAVLLFGRDAIAGLFIGALITGISLKMHFSSIIIISLISALTPYIAFKISTALLNLETTLFELSSKQLLLMSLISAFSSAFFHNLYFYFSGITQELSINFIKMFTGDLIGSLLVLYIFSLLIKLIKKTSASTTPIIKAVTKTYGAWKLKRFIL